MRVVCWVSCMIFAALSFWVFGDRASGSAFIAAGFVILALD